MRTTDLPRRVISLDENLLAFSRPRFPPVTPGLTGFHWYGTDLCLNAIVAGNTAHLIDFPVTHLSPGSPASPAFEQGRRAMIDAWRPRLLVGVVRSTCDEFRVSRVKPLGVAPVPRRRPAVRPHPRPDRRAVAVPMTRPHPRPPASGNIDPFPIGSFEALKFADAGLPRRDARGPRPSPCPRGK